MSNDFSLNKKDMIGEFSIKITNNTSDTQTLSLFELGASGSSVPIESFVQGNKTNPNGYDVSTATSLWDYSGDSITDNNTFYRSDTNDYIIGTHDLTITFISIDNNSSYISPTSSGSITMSAFLESIKQEIIDANLSENSIVINPLEISVDCIPYIKNNGGTYYAKFFFKISIDYKYISNNSFLILDEFVIEAIDSDTETYFFSKNALDTTGTWEVTNTTSNGLTVEQDNGVSYDEILRSQNGNCYAISSIEIQVLSADGVNEADKYTQLLTPIKFTKKDADGKSKVYEKTTSVDPFQYQTALKHITLGEYADKFVLDGQTSLGYDIEANQKIILSINYVKLPNFVFGNAVDLQKIAELNKQQQAEQQELSNQAKTIQLEFEQSQEVIKNNIDKVVKQAKKEDIKDFIVMGALGLLIYKIIK